VSSKAWVKPQQKCLISPEIVHWSDACKLSQNGTSVLLMLALTYRCGYAIWNAKVAPGGRASSSRMAKAQRKYEALFR